MSARRTDEERRRTLMRRGDTGAATTHSIGGIVKQGGYAPRKPSMPKMPWDDEPEEESDGR